MRLIAHPSSPTIKVQELVKYLQSCPRGAPVYVGNPSTPLTKVLIDESDGHLLVVVNPVHSPNVAPEAMFDLPETDA